MENKLFRQKSIDRISSPEELHDYMRVTSPRLWMILGAVAVMLIGFIIYAATTRMETTEKVSMYVDSYEIVGRIPGELQDRIKLNMEVRMDGHTGRITEINNSTEYMLNVSFEGEPPTDGTSYLMSIGDKKDTPAKITDEEFISTTVYVKPEDGKYYLTYFDTKNFNILSSGSNTPVRFWIIDYSGPEAELTGGYPALVHGVEQSVYLKAYVEMDEPEIGLTEGVHEAEIVTESTTPVSFLWN